jgi:hypothetical protein
MKKVLQFPYTFVLMNWAVVVSLYRYSRQGGNACKNIWAVHSQHSHTLQDHG